jgi:SAM-dependent methyltransferase
MLWQVGYRNMPIPMISGGLRIWRNRVTPSKYRTKTKKSSRSCVEISRVELCTDRSWPLDCNVGFTAHHRGQDARSWPDRLRCPRCGARLNFVPDKASCRNRTCIYSDQGFPFADGQPVLIDFVDSLFPRSGYEGGISYQLPRDLSRSGLRFRLRRLVEGDNPVAAKNCDQFLSVLKAETASPRILVIGGGGLGLGADMLYSDPDVDLIGTDVYASRYTDLLADAHKLPFEDATFDGVWIQAVLEHVLDPAVVVAEIRRILKPNGLVYAETPFMQQVHERAYDFTRFTQSGHRWLFRGFTEISSGPVTGPGVVLLWSIRYLLRALGAGEKLSHAVPLLLFWVRVLDRFCMSRKTADSAGGVFFLGRRSDAELPALAMIEYYEGQATASQATASNEKPRRLRTPDQTRWRSAPRARSTRARAMHRRSW